MVKIMQRTRRTQQTERVQRTQRTRTKPSAEVSTPSPEQVWKWLNEVPDPEIPVISVVELGIIRKVHVEGERLVISVTPTYSGCPATSFINIAIENALIERGVENFELKRQLSPPWTTDWISETGKNKLREYGIAPPHRKEDETQTVACPRCGSEDTEEISRFGSTPCKASWRCRKCLEPFDRFKCI